MRRGKTAKPEEVEDQCLDAEAWADELTRWSRSHPQALEAREATALAGMLLALVKSIRLSLFAEASAVDRGYLLEELESTIATSRALATGERVRPLVGGADCPTPPSLEVGGAGVTMRPPPGKSPEEVWAQRDTDPPSSER
jgi:hypothetical protein